MLCVHSGKPVDFKPKIPKIPKAPIVGNFVNSSYFIYVGRTIRNLAYLGNLGFE